MNAVTDNYNGCFKSQLDSHLQIRRTKGQNQGVTGWQSSLSSRELALPASSGSKQALAFSISVQTQFLLLCGLYLLQ